MIPLAVARVHILGIEAFEPKLIISIVSANRLFWFHSLSVVSLKEPGEVIIAVKPLITACNIAELCAWVT